MLRRSFIVTIVAGTLAAALTLAAADLPRRDKSMRLEAKAAVRRALNNLRDAQQEDGSWRGDPAVTGLVVTAMMGSGLDGYGVEDEPVRRGLAYIRKFARPDGGIYGEFYANYTTSICAMALIEAGRPEDRERIGRARDYLLDLQADEGEGFAKKDDQFGGWGYEKHESGEGMHRADMSNTQLALEAVHALQEAAAEDKPAPGEGGASAAGRRRLHEDRPRPAPVTSTT